jgi:hypothetical protein
MQLKKPLEIVLVINVGHVRKVVTIFKIKCNFERDLNSSSLLGCLGLSIVMKFVKSIIKEHKMIKMINLKSAKHYILTLLMSLLYMVPKQAASQNDGVVAGVAIGATALTFLAADAGVKETAKEVSQFRSKEFIMDYIIGPAQDREIKFETESLASDDSAGVVSIAFNCTQLKKKGLLLAFIGKNRNELGTLTTAYGFKYIPYEEAVALIDRIDKVKEVNKDYMKDVNDVNNIYIAHDDMKLIIYCDGSDKIRLFWNGFDVEWERTPFDRTKRRLKRWFE